MTNSFEDLMKMVNIAQSLAAIAARILSERKADQDRHYNDCDLQREDKSYSFLLGPL